MRGFLRARAPRELILAYRGEGEASSRLEVPKPFRDGALLPEEDWLSAFEAGRFAQAIESFKAAHEVLPDPLLLYNLALAHARLDQIPEALKAARRAAQDGLEARVRPRNQARVSAFTTILNGREVCARMARRPLARTDDAPQNFPWIGAGAAALGGRRRQRGGGGAHVGCPP